MIGASRRDTGGGAGAYLREHPLPVFGALAALFLISLGGYVLLQMANPSPLVKQPPRSMPVAPSVPSPAPAASGGTPGAAQPPIPLTSLLPPLREGAAREQPPAQKPAAARCEQCRCASGGAAAPAANGRARYDQGHPGSATPTINPLLSAAYAALSAGKLDSSQQLYQQLLRSEPGNIDALLGLAAIASATGRQRRRQPALPQDAGTRSAQRAGASGTDRHARPGRSARRRDACSSS